MVQTLHGHLHERRREHYLLTALDPRMAWAEGVPTLLQREQSVGA